MYELFGYPDWSRTFNFCVMCFVFVLGLLEFSPMVFYGVGLSHGIVISLNFYRLWRRPWVESPRTCSRSWPCCPWKSSPLFLFPCCVFCIRARILEIASHGVLWGWFWATVLESLWIFCWLCRQWWSSLWWLWWIFKWERTKCTSQVMIVEWPLWSIGGGYSLRDVSYCFVVRLMRLSLVFCSMVRIFPLHRPCHPSLLP